MKPVGLCVYSGSGKLPLLCAAGAFFALAIAMVVQHTFLLIAVSKSTTLPLINWDPDSDSFKALTWQAGSFFVATWYDGFFNFLLPPFPIFSISKH